MQMRRVVLFRKAAERAAPHALDAKCPEQFVWSAGTGGSCGLRQRCQCLQVEAIPNEVDHIWQQFPVSTQAIHKSGLFLKASANLHFSMSLVSHGICDIILGGIDVISTEHRVLHEVLTHKQASA